MSKIYTVAMMIRRIPLTRMGSRRNTAIARYPSVHDRIIYWGKEQAR
jgi:hypothetical protein